MPDSSLDVDVRWVNVVVYDNPNTNRPPSVNVYGYATKAEAESSQRRMKRDIAERGVASAVIANRVRPVLCLGRDYDSEG